MQIQISAEEIFAEYKQQNADLLHEVVMGRAQIRKMAEQIEQYENAEYLRVQEAARIRPRAVVTASETLPDTLDQTTPSEGFEAPPVAGEG